MDTVSSVSAVYSFVIVSSDGSDEERILSKRTHILNNTNKLHISKMKLDALSIFKKKLQPKNQVGARNYLQLVDRQL